MQDCGDEVIKLAIGKYSDKSHLWVKEKSRSRPHILVLEDFEWIIHLSLLNPADVKFLSVLIASLTKLNLYRYANTVGSTCD